MLDSLNRIFHLFSNAFKSSKITLVRDPSSRTPQFHRFPIFLNRGRFFCEERIHITNFHARSNFKQTFLRDVAWANKPLGNVAIKFPSKYTERNDIWFFRRSGGNAVRSLFVRWIWFKLYMSKEKIYRYFCWIYFHKQCCWAKSKIP